MAEESKMFHEVYHEVYMRLYLCVECGEDIQVGEEMVCVYKDDFRGECWVHSGECLENYMKSVTGPEAVKQGMILGLCDACAKPIRENQKYAIGTLAKSIERNLGKRLGALATIPSSENGIYVYFQHLDCKDNSG